MCLEKRGLASFVWQRWGQACQAWERRPTRGFTGHFPPFYTLRSSNSSGRWLVFSHQQSTRISSRCDDRVQRRATQAHMLILRCTPTLLHRPQWHRRSAKAGGPCFNAGHDGLITPRLHSSSPVIIPCERSAICSCRRFSASARDADRSNGIVKRSLIARRQARRRSLTKKRQMN